jgi:hypothetical protein
MPDASLVDPFYACAGRSDQSGSRNMTRTTATVLALLALAGCGVTRDQLKQATYDCRDRNFD